MATPIGIPNRKHTFMPNVVEIGAESQQRQVWMNWSQSPLAVERTE
jgi:hypothetical protein